MASHPRLAGRHVLVTGGSRGIGRAVAERFAREGASVAISHLGDAEAAAATLEALHVASREAGDGGCHHAAIEADVADEAAVEAMTVEAIARLGGLDGLVANAGIQAETPGATFAAVDLARILAVNLTGVALCARAALAHFVSRPGGGGIVVTTSVHETIPKPGFLGYAMSKGGLGALTRTLALEFAGRGIRVNAVGPGAVETAMNAAWVDDPVARERVAAHIPLGRAARAEEIAPVYAFLMSEEARYITGQTVYACGGLTLYGDFATNWAS